MAQNIGLAPQISSLAPESKKIASHMAIAFVQRGVHFTHEAPTDNVETIIVDPGGANEETFTIKANGIIQGRGCAWKPAAWKTFLYECFGINL